MKKTLLLFVLFGLFATNIFAQFKVTVRTTTPNETIYFRLVGGNYTIDWGDGFINSNNFTHTYAVPGDYQISATGTFTGMNGGQQAEQDKIRSIDQWGNTAWSGNNLAVAFKGCSNLEMNALDTPNLSNVTSLVSLFQDCTSLGNGNGNWNWDMSNVQYIGRMFQGATSFNKNISSWNMGNVVNAYSMFQDATSFNQNIGSWNVSSLTNMQEMFQGASSFNQDISGWDVSNVTSLSNTFKDATSFNQDISSWDVSNVTQMYGTFDGAVAFDQDLGIWNVSNVNNFSKFLNNVKLSIINYDSLLIGWSAINKTGNNILDAGNSTFCSEAAAIAKQNLISEGFNVIDKGVDVSCFDPFVTTWKTDNPGGSNSTSITVPVLGQIGVGFDVDWDNDGVFDEFGLTNTITHDFGVAGTYTIAIKGQLNQQNFNSTGGDNDKILSIDKWGDNKWSSLAGAFQGCSNLVVNAIDVPNLSNITSLSQMFKDCTSLGNGSGNWNWDVSTITNMGGVFWGATSFNEDISSWDVSNVTGMGSMFNGVALSTGIYDAILSGWSGQTLQNNVVFTAGNSQYCDSASRQSIIDNFNWTIQDGGESPNCGPVTLIPDTNFEQALIDLGIDSDGTVNGQVFTSDIATLTTLDVFSKNISDLTGIEDFVALTSLYCNNNNLSSLNISSNTALENLDCSANDLSSLDVNSNVNLVYLHCGENNLSSLDVSNNTSLTDLVCNANSITSLDVSNNSLLYFLGCNENNLTSLDVSSNTALEILYCASNSIVELDLTANPALNDFDCSNNNLANLNVQSGNNTNLAYFDATGNSGLVCIQVDDVTYSNTNWSNKDSQTNYSLDCSGLQTYVPDDAFEQALIDLGHDSGPLNNYVPTVNIDGIVSLDVSSKGIVDLTGIESFISLEDLNCNNNNLSSIDLSNNTALAFLLCRDNNFSSLDVSNNLALYYLDCGSNGISNLDVSNNTLLTHLICNDNSLSSLIVGNNTLLTYLQCSSNMITNLDLSGLSSFTGLFCQNNDLGSLNLQNGNNINIEYYDVTNNPSLICIQVDDVAYSNTNLTNKDAQTSYSLDCVSQTYVPDDAFEQALVDLGYDTLPLDDYVLTSFINSITTLDVSWLVIQDLTGIEDFIALEYLYCSNNNLSSLDVSNNLNLVSLYCDVNNLSSLMLGSNTNLDELICSDNSLTDLDLSLNTSLTILGCSNNNLTSLNVKNGNNTNFTSFYATGNPGLSCIQVDDVTYSNANWTNKDAQTSYSISCGPQTYVPDDNFEQALINLGYDSGPLDDYVPTALISVVTDLDISYGGISELTGIEDFAALERLDCSNNNLTNLDLSGNPLLDYLHCYQNGLNNLNVSNNPLLESLVCWNNNLSSLDVSNNPVLYFLSCTDNDLTSLDVSNNTSLGILYCALNTITALDVSANPSLNDLDCSNNSLTSLNVQNGNNTNFSSFDATGNPSLTCIQVDDAAYSTPNWTNIDPQTSFSLNCSPITLILDTNFEQALINLGIDTDATINGQVFTSDISSVTSLNVSFENISDLTGIEDFSALEVLDCSSNDLASLDISNNLALTNLDCESNSLTSLDVGNNTNLIELNCYNNDLSSLDVSTNIALEYLSCGVNNLTTLNIDNNTALRHLNCLSNNLTSLNIDNNIALTFLDCRSNNLGSLNVNNNLVLETLQCDNTGLNNIDVSSNSVLKYLYLRENNLTSLDVTNNLLLEWLDCGYNNLTSLDLTINTALVRVYCYFNAITSLDVSNSPNLYVFLCKDNNLESLNVKNGNNTNIGNFQANNNPNLTCIEVDDVAYSTANWTSIDAQTSYSLNCNPQTYVPDDAFEQALIDLGYDSGPLDDYVPTSNIDGITNLNVSNKGISDLTGIEGFISLESLDCSNNSLINLNLSGNTIITSIECWNNSLTSLDVTNTPALVNLHCSTNNLNSLDVSSSLSLATLNCSYNSLGSLDVSNNVAITNLNCDNNDLSNLDLSNNASLTHLQCTSNSLSNLDVSNNVNLVALSCDDNSLSGLDLSNNTSLVSLVCRTNQLSSLNIQNGNNVNIFTFDALFNPSLTCIQVDDVAYSDANWSNKDVQSSYSTNCNSLSSNYLVVENDNVFTGETNNINLLLENDETIKGFQFDITLPSGFVFNPADIVNIGLPASFQITASGLGGNVYRVLGFSLSNETIVPNSAPIINLPTFIEESTVPGDYSIPITNVTLSDINNTDIADPSPSDGIVTVFNYPMGDPNEDDTVNILDILAVIDHIFGNTPTNFNTVLADVNEDNTINVLDILEIQDIIFASSRISKTNSKNTKNDRTGSRLVNENYLVISNIIAAINESTTIDIELHNDDIVKGMEFDFVLPEGFTFNPSNINATSRLTGFNVTAQEISENTYKVLIFSLSASTVQVGTSSILSLPVFIEAGTSNGSYPISFTNVIISDINNTNVSTLAPSVGEVTVSTLGSNKVFKTDIILYPNPAKDIINISSQGLVTNADILIYDILGKLISETKLLNKDDFLNVSYLNSGVYFIKVKTKEMEFIKRFVKL